MTQRSQKVTPFFTILSSSRAGISYGKISRYIHTVGFLLGIFLYPFLQTQAQTTADDAFYIKGIYDHSLSDNPAWRALNHLVSSGNPRPAGSDTYRKAALGMGDYMRNIGFDTVYYQEVTVPTWIRGPQSIVSYRSGGQEVLTHSLALGNSGGTGPGGLTANVLALDNVNYLDSLPPEEIEGKIVFFFGPMDPTLINTFNAYGRAVDQRYRGPVKASEKGAAAVIVRSMTLTHDTVPHTGTCGLQPDGPPAIPAIAISTVDSDMLREALQRDPNLEIYIENYSRFGPDRKDYTVIGEKRGTEYPDEIILAGGHLDSWDVGQGAHDDGSGCAHAVSAFETLFAKGYKPRRTFRCVLFANEEKGLSGGKEYARVSNEKKEFHLAAIESDAGGFTPRGFGVSGNDTLTAVYMKALYPLWDLLEPYDLFLKAGGGGADINPLKSQGGALIGFRPDSQRYFDFHHTRRDRIENVNPRELALGSAAIASIIYLIDKYGLDGE